MIILSIELPLQINFDRLSLKWDLKPSNKTPVHISSCLSIPIFSAISKLHYVFTIKFPILFTFETLVCLTCLFCFLLYPLQSYLLLKAYFSAPENCLRAHTWSFLPLKSCRPEYTRHSTRHYTSSTQFTFSTVLPVRQVLLSPFCIWRN